MKLAYLGNDKSPVVFAETDIVPEIESHQTDYVEIEATVPVLGAQTIVAIVALEGDGNPSNDKTFKNLPVKFEAGGSEGGSAYEVEISLEVPGYAGYTRRPGRA